MQTYPQQTQPLINKLANLPPERIDEVNDFIDFLLMREQKQPSTATIACLSEPALTKVWNNEEDAIYDQL